MKFNKVRKSRNIIYSLLYIVGFIVRDVVNHFLLLIFNNAINDHKNRNERILFIEPIKQGYGDLFFQTPLFECWNQLGYKISILTNKKHLQIIENNPNFQDIYIWKLSDLVKIFKKEYLIIGLGRDTLSETFLMLLMFKSKKIFIDKDLELWKKSFNNLNNIRAWQILTSQQLDIKYNYKLPSIYFSKKEKNYINKLKINSYKKIGIICGIEKESKRFLGMNKIIDQITKDKYKIILFGKDRLFKNGRNKAINLVNKLNYRKTLLEIASCDLIIGTEGSLTQIAAKLLPMIIVIDSENRFIKNVDPRLIIKAKIINQKSSNEIINNTLNQIERFFN